MSRLLDMSDYPRWLAPWRDVAGDRLRVIFLEDFKVDWQRHVSDIWAGLGLASPEPSLEQGPVRNPSVTVRLPRLHRAARRLVPWVRSKPLGPTLRKWYRAAQFGHRQTTDTMDTNDLAAIERVESYFRHERPTLDRYLGDPAVSERRRNP
jgi:hypothetical protein